MAEDAGSGPENPSNSQVSDWPWKVNENLDLVYLHTSNVVPRMATAQAVANGSPPAQTLLAEFGLSASTFQSWHATRKSAGALRAICFRWAILVFPVMGSGNNSLFLIFATKAA